MPPAAAIATRKQARLEKPGNRLVVVAPVHPVHALLLCGHGMVPCFLFDMVDGNVAIAIIICDDGIAIVV